MNPRQEPYEVIPHVRIRAGGRSQGRSLPRLTEIGGQTSEASRLPLCSLHLAPPVKLTKSNPDGLLSDAMLSDPSRLGRFGRKHRLPSCLTVTLRDFSVSVRWDRHKSDNRSLLSNQSV